MPVTLRSPKQLREERNKLAKEIRTQADKVNAENRDFTAEEKANWEKVNADYNALTTQIEIAERAAAIDKDQDDPAGDGKVGRGDLNGKKKRGKQPRRKGPTEEQRALSIQAWLRAQSGLELKTRHIEAARACGTQPTRRTCGVQLAKNYRQVQKEFRAMSAVAGPSGGFTVPEGFVNSLENALLAFGGVRQVADVMRTEGGNELPWPTVNDTANEGEILTENQAVTEATPSFGQILFQAFKFSSKLVKVPVELLEDSAFDLVTWLGDALGTRIARIQNRKFTVGTGTGEPNGVVTAASLGVTTASATAITGDELIGLVHALDPAYRDGASWMLHDSILLALRRLKDGNSNYMWQSGLQQGHPDKFLSYSLTINQHMQSSISASTKTVLFGQFKKYKIRDVRVMRMRRLVERYADTDQEGFVGFMRSDGNLLDAGTHPLVYMLQHS